MKTDKSNINRKLIHIKHGVLMRIFLRFFILIIGFTYCFPKVLTKDPTFLCDTTNDYSVWNMNLQSDGKLLINFFDGDYLNLKKLVCNWQLVRLNQNGTIDSTFILINNQKYFGWWNIHLQNVDFLFHNERTNLGIYPNNYKLQKLYKHDEFGKIDANFKYDSIVFTDSHGKIINQYDLVHYILKDKSSIIILPNSDGDSLFVFKIDSLGKKDETFKTQLFKCNQYKQYSGIHKISEQYDGKLILSCGIDSCETGRLRYLVRLNKNGSFDTTFKSTGTNHFYTYANVLPNNKILMKGGFTEINGVNMPGVAILNSDGTTDTTFKPDITRAIGDTVIFAVFDSSNHIIVYYENKMKATFKLKILNLDGSEDKTIDIGGDFEREGLMHNLVVTPNGKYIAFWNKLRYFNNNRIGYLDRLALFELITGKTKNKACRGDYIEVPYQASGPYARNKFTVQISDSLGSFTKARVIGVGDSSLSGVVRAQIPADLPAGNKYRVRVISTTPIVSENDNGEDIAIFAAPVTKFAGAKKVCENATEVYKIPQEYGVAYEWVVKGGTMAGSSIDSTISVNWTDTTSASITLNATNNIAGCKSTFTLPIEVVPTPSDTISGAENLCIGAKEQYSTVASFDNSYEWRVTGGTVSGSSKGYNVYIIWDSAGIHKLSLKVTNKAIGCTAENVKNINIFNNPKPTLIGPTNVCEGDTVTLTADLDAGLDYEWNALSGRIIGDSKSNSIKIVWTGVSSDSIWLKQTIKSAGCSGFGYKIVSINRSLSPQISGTNSICEGDTIVLHANQEPGLNYEWIVKNATVIGAANAPSIKLASLTGDISVTLKENYPNTSCAGESSQTIAVNKAPIATIIGETNAQLGDTAKYEVQNDSDLSYVWKVEGGNIIGTNSANAVNINWDKETQGSISLVIINKNTGCKSEFKKSVTVNSSSIEIGLADLRKKTGEHFSLPIFINKSRNIDLLKTTNFELVIKYNKTVMAPANINSSDISESGYTQYLTLRGELKNTLGKIGEYEFIAALGNDSCTTIQIDTVRWIGANIPTVTIPGNLCITDICRTCGDRLVDPTKKLAFNQVKLEQVGESIIVNFEVNEKAPTQIKLFNILGETIYSQDFTPLDYENNSHKININSLSSGVYFISISNDERRITKAVSVGK